MSDFTEKIEILKDEELVAIHGGGSNLWDGVAVMAAGVAVVAVSCVVVASAPVTL